ncbi:MAG: ABC transporter permease [Actinomycetota bacterium]|nr:ABC transporter permease [Actinomycetota bacterium]
MAVNAAELPDAPPAEYRFRRQIRFLPSMRELWGARELMRSLAERDIRARYKQAVLGFAWSILTPVALMIAFTLVFERIGNVDTHGVAYPLFSYVALLPWHFFTSSVSQGGQSLLTNKALLNKVYCPREVFPLSSGLVASFDTLISTAILGVLFALYTFAPRIETFYVPVLLLVQIFFTVGITLIVSAVTVYLRDLRHALPILLQLGLFATPVGYGLEEIAAEWRPLYSAINPLGPVIDGYRQTVLFGSAPDWELLGIAAVSSVVFLVVGYRLFKHLETGFADVA